MWTESYLGNAPVRGLVQAGKTIYYDNGALCRDEGRFFILTRKTFQSAGLYIAFGLLWSMWI